MRTLLLVVGVSILGACGDDDVMVATDAGPVDATCRTVTDGQMPDPVAQCEDLLDAICDREVECSSSPLTHRDCIDLQRDVIDCGVIVGVRDSYDRCINDIRSQSCVVWNADNVLPASCSRVLETC